jgi:ABC-2 type transport system permease protein
MRVYRAHIAAVLVPLFRTPVYWVPVIVFPTLLYSFFGLPPSLQSPAIANVLLASWSAFAVIGVGFFQFGVSIAQSRESKWEEYARTLPIGAAPRLVAQAAAAVVFTSMALALLWTVSVLTGASTLGPVQFARLFAVLAGGVIPFVLMGAALGYLMPPRGAVPIANLIYLPLSYFGGLWIPPSMLPDAVATVSMFTPTRHLGELAWASVLGRDLPLASIQVLAVYAVVAAAIALIMWRRDETLRAR